MIAEGGRDTSPGGLLTASSVGNITFTLGSDTIVTGEGNDTIYAGVKDMALLSTGGEAVNALSTASIGVAAGGSLITFGDNVVDAGGGNDLIVGDADHLSLIAMGGEVIGEGLLSQGRIINSSITMADDDLNGGAGSDTIYGDLVSLTLHLENDGAGSVGLMTGNTLRFGSDIIKGDEGDDILIGDVEDITGLGDFLIANTVISGENEFVYDGLIDNGDDIILDFDTSLDVLKAENGAMFSDGGLNGGNLVVNVTDAGLSSTIVLVGVTDFGDVMTV